MDHATDVLKIFAGVILVCLVIGITFKIFNQGAAAGDVAGQQIAELQNAMETEKYMAYESNDLRGSDVLGAINNFKTSTFCVSVDNGNQVVEYGRKSSDLKQKADGRLADAKDISNVTSVYISPSDSYTGTLMYDNSGTIIIGLEFVKN